MDIKKFRKKYHISNADIIRVVSRRYPKFGKYPLFMVANQNDYGVMLTPGAEETLFAVVDRKKPCRKKNHQLTVGLDDKLFRYFREFCEANEVNAQDAIEEAIARYVLNSR